ncbi:sulfur transfer protein involved in thiamine biosynthesis [Pedobacter sp. BAL39]|nr:sulfur transfer protein involved in thiamine biosynthesis [Pedobacter sp. BAL39]
MPLVFPNFYKMEITVNHENYQINEHCSITELLHDVLTIPVQGIAVAINQTIIPKTEWPSQRLSSGDRVMVIKATQGG